MDIFWSQLNHANHVVMLHVTAELLVSLHGFEIHPLSPTQHEAKILITNKHESYLPICQISL
jgi:hypothetical protein